MCGIAGKLSYRSDFPVQEDQMRQMLAMIRHRGPDQFGIYLGENVGLGSARLSIIDLNTGQQPICNEDGTLWIVFNGEIFNYHELRCELQARGHVFSTETDTETILHLYEELGPACLNKLNGQFAIAIWETKRKRLFLARDRLGVRPLFYAQGPNSLIFGSEMKAIFSTGEITPELDPIALDQIFTFWSTLSPRATFRGIVELPPGHYLIAENGQARVHKYWNLRFASGPQGFSKRADESYLEQFRELLIDATKMRLHADVPVGAYLSGGLDSSTIASVIRKHTTSRLDTFSIAFSDEHFDESEFQRCMAKFLGTDHQVIVATHSDIGRIFPEVIWHTETVVMRTSPAPMFLLSRLVRERNFKVVLTGEGADEFLGGYDIFKEAKVRRFWGRQPNSKWRHLLLKRLYPDIRELSKNSSSFMAAFFGDALTDLDAPDYSHAVRWRNNRRTTRFFSDMLTDNIAKEAALCRSISYPPEFWNWGPLERAQYLESTIFLSQYLLSSQGDRMAMANSVEGRFPFLDHRIVEFCTELPPTLKLRGLTEKYLLKRLGRELLPPAIWSRPKRPYRAPIHRSFFSKNTADYVKDLLSSREIQRAGFFKPAAVAQLVRKIESGAPIGETDDMALVGIISTQLLHHQFVSNFKTMAPLSKHDDVRVCFSSNTRKAYT